MMAAMCAARALPEYATNWNSFKKQLTINLSGPGLAS